jgi:hypothetical protein
VFQLLEGTEPERVKGVDAVNALVWIGPDLIIASDDGAYLAESPEQVRKLASGAFVAAARAEKWVYLAGKGGVVRLEWSRGELARWGPEQGVRVAQPTSLSWCGEHLLCAGGAAGLRRYRIDPEDGRLSEAPGGEALPEPFVTALASGDWYVLPDQPWKATAWAGTFGGGLVQLGERPLAPADGLPEGRIAPRALAVKDDVAFAGTPRGLLVARGRSAALVPVGGPVTAVTVSSRSGVWVGLPGQLVRVELEISEEPPPVPIAEQISSWGNPW